MSNNGPFSGAVHLSQDIETERRLAAVLAADVAGYSRLTEADEIGTLRLLAAQRAILDDHICRHRGRLANTAGDSVLAEFPSAVNAVQCAVEAQQALRDAAESIPEDRRLLFRIGIHVGDVMVRGGDLLGTGVNVAARLEGLADAGGIVLSAAAHEQVKKILPLAYTDLGPQSVKNIEEPVRAFAIGERTAASASAQLSKPLTLPDKPSIAVLPFQNMSGDPEQEYFADGMVEDIITALSRFKSLFVIARNSSFTYKGKAVDIKQVGREVGVRYVLEGSVRKAGGRVRITGQLIEAETNNHLWANRFDGALDNVFELQDEVANAVAAALDPVVATAEIARVSRKPLAKLDAYDCFLRASANVDQWTDETNEAALRLFYRAIELEPDYARAYANVTWCYAWRTIMSGRLSPDEQREAERLAREAVRLGRDDGFCLVWAGFSLQVNLGKLREGADLIDRGLELNINLARAWNLSGWSRLWLGQPDVAIAHLERAMRLNPLDPAFHAMEHAVANAHMAAGRYAEASLWAEKSLRRLPMPGPALILAQCRASMGEMGGAREAVERALQLNPRLSISMLGSMPIWSNYPVRWRFVAELYRKIGLPE